MLCQRPLCLSHGLTALVKDERPAETCALIECENELTGAFLLVRGHVWEITESAQI